MIKQDAQSPSIKSMNVLSRALLLPGRGNELSASKIAWLESEVRNISWDEFGDLLTLANLNHVVVRGLEALLGLKQEAKDDTAIEWAQAALAAERKRIGMAVTFLHDICTAFEDGKHDVTIIKSLDHWPDLGSDLDLYTDANPEDISELMKRCFGAQIAPRSLGDRLGCKWNFLIPGLPEVVEVHMGRLGQTGEQTAIASRIAKRSRLTLVGGYEFRVASPSDRVIISTLQRMYRHFYFRLCDIVDTVALLEMGGFDFEDLRSSASNAGIWEGVATYLAIVSDYAKQYRGTGLDLPQFVTASARFGGHEVHYGRGFLRVPIMPQSASLYGSQIAGLLRKGELHNSARLSLLPWLATAAAIGHKITGSDKGIW